MAKRLALSFCVLIVLVITNTAVAVEQSARTKTQVVGSDYFYEDIPVFGKLPPKERLAVLKAMGDQKAASKLRAKIERNKKSGHDVSAAGLFSDEPYEWTAHAYGYFPFTSPGPANAHTIQHAGNIDSDKTLKKIRIVLDKLRVFNYPGSGTHQVMFDFYSQNMADGKPEHLHFNQKFAALEGQEAAVIGFPIFNELNVGSSGAVFKCVSINVSNDSDEKILSFLDSDTAKGGLSLLATAQPAIAPLAGLAIGLTQQILSRNRNVKVQDISMGLDFQPKGASGARLAEGTYVAVQISDADAAVWDWNQWVYDSTNGRIVKKDDRSKLIPNNYMMFRVSAS